MKPTKKTKLPKAWKQFKIGNALRGHYYFKARSLEEGWRKGCQIFNAGFPCRAPGRPVGLFERKFGDPLPTNTEIRKGLMSKHALEYWQTMMERAKQPAEWWQPVAQGLSRRKLNLLSK